jgi:V8-like Glu-specific endopeptidase
MSNSPGAFVAAVRDLISHGELDAAVDQMVAYFKATRHHLENNARVQAGRLRTNERFEHQGLRSPSDSQIERNKVAHSLLGLLDHLLKDPPTGPSPFVGDPIPVGADSGFGAEKIFGVSHLKSIAWLSRGVAAARSVCRIKTPDSLGTGFLISGNRIITNWHVIRDAREAGLSVAQFNYEEDLDGRPMELVEYDFDGPSYRADDALDVCVVTVKPRPSGPPVGQWGALEWGTGAPAVGDHVSIIQHPQGGPKQIALTANQVVSIYEHRLLYSTDTLPGSSGSPVFDDAWKVRAVHRGGGNLVIDKSGRRAFANEGVLTSYVLSALALALA